MKHAPHTPTSTVLAGPRATSHEPRPLIIGHRGFPHRFPDNSLAGVRAALAAGADGVEVDVRLCAEDVWVCHHDRTRHRRPISEWSLAALARAGVPSLASVVDALPPQAWLFVEVKPLAREAFERCVGDLLDLVMPRNTYTMLISSSETVLGVAELACPTLARSYVFGEMPEWLPANVALSPKHTLVEELLPTGRTIHPWTVDRVRRARALAVLGVASITSNRPGLIREALID